MIDTTSDTYAQMCEAFFTSVNDAVRALDDTTRAFRAKLDRAEEIDASIDDIARDAMHAFATLRDVIDVHERGVRDAATNYVLLDDEL